MEVKIEGLRKRFGDTVACDIAELAIGDGEIVGFVGNNGAGKTTLFRLALDLQKADEGKVVVGGIDVAKSEGWKPLVGAYLDDGFLIDFLTPEEYFSFLSKIAGVADGETERRLADFELFCGGEIFGKNTLIRNLSAGNRQKVGIMSAFFRHPQLVILDEPFNYLDPTSQSALKRCIRGYRENSGATVLISSHNLAHTIDISTRIALLEHGRIIRDIPNNGETDIEEELNSYFEAV